jgi:hypothetical protein
MKHRKLKKSERNRFVKEATALIQRYGGEIGEEIHRNSVDNDLRSSLTMHTRFGPLDLNVTTNSTEGPGTVFARFKYARLAKQGAGASYPSGKWNHHYFGDFTVEQALDDIEDQLKLIQPTALEEFMDETSLVPRAVVETLFAERSVGQFVDPPYMGTNGLNANEALQWFVAHVEQRIVFLYDNNLRLRIRLQSDSGRDVLYAFVDHWIDAYVECPPDYRKRHPMIEEQFATIGA